MNGPSVFADREEAFRHFRRIGSRNLSAFLTAERIDEWARQTVATYIDRGSIIVKDVNPLGRVNTRALVVAACDDLLFDVMEEVDGARLALSVLQELSLRMGNVLTESRAFAARVCYAAAIGLLHDRAAEPPERTNARFLIKARLGA